MQQTLYPRLVLDALATVRYPGNGKNIVEADMVADDMRIDGNRVSFSLIFDRPTDPFIKSLTKAAETAVKTFASDDAEVTVNVVTRQAAPQWVNPLPGVKNIIGISSGKGGVGKSTVSSNLAVALAREGYKVGLLDADIFGPSVPKMFGVEGAQIFVSEVNGKNMIEPVEQYGVKMLSIGFMVDPDASLTWRGGMASRALTQLITEANWGELDYFLIDMPPGTSDIHLTLVQTLAMTGIIIVTTPQQVALADARRGISMFTDEKVNVPVLGMVENMAYFVPEKHPDERYYIFGREGAFDLARKLNIPVLAQIPIVGRICEAGDTGQPVVLDDTITSQAFIHLAHELTDAVDRRNRDLPATERVKVN